jgi:ABC-2 type transport system permease protein
MSTIYILWLRQVKRYLRSKSRIIGSLGQPLLFLITFGFGFGSVYQKAGQGNYMQFLAPGIIIMSVLFTAVFSGAELIWDKQFGFLKETLVAPVPRYQIMLGRTLGGATVAVFQGVIVLALTLIVGFKPDTLQELLLGFILIFLVAILFTSVGTIIASLMEDMQGFQLIMNFLVMPTFFLSGAIFPLTTLPPLLKVITTINPLTYGVDGVRGAFIGASNYSFGFDFFITAGVTFVLLTLGSYLFSKIQV